MYAIFPRMFIIVLFCLGFSSFLALAGFIGVVILQAIFTPAVNEKHPWAVIAKNNNLIFKPSPFNYLGNGSKIVGTYRGFNLKLEFIEWKYSSKTYLTLRNDGIADEDYTPHDTISSNRSISVEDVVNAITSHSLPDDLGGTIKVLHKGREIKYEQSGRETDIDYLQTVFDLVCDVGNNYFRVVSWGGKAVPALENMVVYKHPLRSVAVRLIESIGWETKKRLGQHYAQLLCPDCLVRCNPHKVPLQLWHNITYYGCRNCGQSKEFLDFAGLVVVVLDYRTAMAQLEQNGKLYANWFARSKLFDFGEVQIIHATDEDVERFAVQVGNDTDPFRGPRYKQMQCLIWPECELSENTMRILRRTFGRVEVGQD